MVQDMDRDTHFGCPKRVRARAQPRWPLCSGSAVVSSRRLPAYALTLGDYPQIAVPLVQHVFHLPAQILSVERSRRDLWAAPQSENAIFINSKTEIGR